MSAGQWAQAAEKFREVIRIRSAPDALIALGIAERNLGHLLEAQSTYKQAIEGARAQKLVKEESAALEALILVQAQIPRIKVDTGDGGRHGWNEKGAFPSLFVCRLTTSFCFWGVTIAKRMTARPAYTFSFSFFATAKKAETSSP